MDKLKPFLHKFQTRFRDVDGLGHLNNAVYNSITENARCHMIHAAGLVKMGGVLDRSFPFTLARSEIDYLKPLFFPGEVRIEMMFTHLGVKSAILEFRILSDDGIAARGKQVIVWFDHHKQEAAPVPEWARKILEAILGPKDFYLT